MKGEKDDRREGGGWGVETGDATWIVESIHLGS